MDNKEMAKKAIETYKRYAKAVNTLSFNTKAFVDDEDTDEFTKISEIFVYLMANASYTDGRNQMAKERCQEYLPKYRKMFVTDPEGFEAIDLPYSEGSLPIFMERRNLGEYPKEAAVAIMMSREHKTLQQTFTQACLYRLMKDFGDLEALGGRRYSLPLI